MSQPETIKSTPFSLTYSVIAGCLGGASAGVVVPYLGHMISLIPMESVAQTLAQHPVQAFVVGSASIFFAIHAHNVAIETLHSRPFYQNNTEWRWLVSNITMCSFGVAASAMAAYLLAIEIQVALSISAASAVAVILTQIVIGVFASLAPQRDRKLDYIPQLPEPPAPLIITTIRTEPAVQPYVPPIAAEPTTNT